MIADDDTDNHSVISNDLTPGPAVADPFGPEHALAQVQPATVREPTAAQEQAPRVIRAHMLHENVGRGPEAAGQHQGKAVQDMHEGLGEKLDAVAERLDRITDFLVEVGEHLKEQAGGLSDEQFARIEELLKPGYELSQKMLDQFNVSQGNAKGSKPKDA